MKLSDTSHLPTSQVHPRLSRRRMVLGAMGVAAVITAVGVPYGHAATPRRLDVTDFGARGDGHSDDTQAIAAADAAAREAGARLHFPAGTYRAFGLRPTVSWVSDAGAIIMASKQVHGLETQQFLRVEDATGLTFAGLTFDGWVTQDPEQWTAANMHGFDGAVPFILARSTGIVIRNCIFRNAYGSPLRIEFSTDVAVEGCHMIRARNPWGDATYVTASTDIRYRDCHARDYTRIGFVAENQSPQGTHDVTYESCTASGGHDGSILYGGTEYNAGFWSENSQGTRYQSCTSKRNTHYGFIFASGKFTYGTAKVSIKDSVAIDNPVGFKVGSWGDYDIDATVSSCTSQPGAGVVKAPSSGFLFTPRYATDRFIAEDVRSVIRPTVADPDGVHLRVEALLPDVAATMSLTNATLVRPRASGTTDVRVSGPYTGTIRLHHIRGTRPIRVTVVEPAAPVWDVSRASVVGVG